MRVVWVFFDQMRGFGGGLLNVELRERQNMP